MNFKIFRWNSHSLQRSGFHFPNFCLDLVKNFSNYKMVSFLQLVKFYFKIPILVTSLHSFLRLKSIFLCLTVIFCSALHLHDLQHRLTARRTLRWSNFASAYFFQPILTRKIQTPFSSLIDIGFIHKTLLCGPCDNAVVKNQTRKITKAVAVSQLPENLPDNN